MSPSNDITVTCRWHVNSSDCKKKGKLYTKKKYLDGETKNVTFLALSTAVKVAALELCETNGSSLVFIMNNLKCNFLETNIRALDS